MLWKRLLSSVLLLLLLSQSLFSEVVLTDEEYNVIMTALNTSEQDLLSNKRLMKASESLTTTQFQELELLKTSSKEQKIDSFLAGLEIFFWGLVSGLVLGFYSGFKIGNI